MSILEIKVVSIGDLFASDILWKLLLLVWFERSAYRGDFWVRLLVIFATWSKVLFSLFAIDVFIFITYNFLGLGCISAFYLRAESFTEILQKLVTQALYLLAQTFM